MPEYLQSIEQVEESQIFKTGCNPLLVHCNNLEYYVCKYSTSLGAANLLFRELLAASFLQVWNLNVPSFAFVNLQKHHNPISIPNIKNDIPCFGSLHNREYREIDAFIGEATASQKSKFVNKIDLLKIALFDLWVSNEDRNHNNYNIMLSLENDKYQFVPIDGNFIFHTGNQHKETFTLSVDETILSSPLLFSIFKLKELTDEQTIDTLKENYYFCTQSCKLALEEIFNTVPDKWLINKSFEYENLHKFLFADSWIDECWTTFLEYLQLSINSKTNGNSI